MATLEITADVSSAQPVPIRAALVTLADGTVTPTASGFRIEGTVEGEDPEIANRQLFATLSRIDPRATLRAQWKVEGTVHRFVDLTAQRTFAAASA